MYHLYIHLPKRGLEIRDLKKSTSRLEALPWNMQGPVAAMETWMWRAADVSPWLVVYMEDYTTQFRDYISHEIRIPIKSINQPG